MAYTDEVITGPSVKRLIAMFVTLFLPMVLVVALVYWLEGPRLEREAYRELESIAHLKARQIESWLEERMGDGHALVKDPRFVRLVRAVENNQADARAALRQRLQTVLDAYRYDVISIVDEDGGRLLQISTDATQHPLPPEPIAPSEGAATGVDEATASSPDEKPADHIDYYVTGDLAHLDFAFPLYASTASAAPFATLVLHMDSERFLFPYSDWLPAGKSAETLLVKQSGDHVLFITPLRHRKSTLPGTLSRRLDDPTLPAAYALRHGGPGTFKGRDYRDVEVLAAYQAVGDTGWKLIAKFDRDEVMAPLDTLVTWVGLVTLLSAILIGLLFMRLWRQEKRLHRFMVEKERHRSDTLLSQFYEMPFIGIAVTSPHSKRWLRFNDRLCEILGYTREELIEKDWAEVTHPDDLDADVEEFERVMRNESDGYSMDKRYIRKDGSLVNVYIDVKCVRDVDGSVDHFVAMVQDITERKQAENALDEARRQVQRYLDIVGVLIVGLDSAANIRMINRRGCQILGYSEQELLGKNWFELCVPAQERDELRAVFRRLLAGDADTAGQLENEVVTRTGEMRYLAWHNTVLRDAHGAVTTILSSGMDLTAQRAAQRSLGASEGRLRTLVQTIPDPVWLKDRDGVFLSCNPVFERLLGASEADILGKTDYDFVDKELADSFREHDRSAMAAGKPSTNEETVTFAADGYQGIFETTKTPMYDRKGRLIGVLGIAHDITERKQALAQIEKLSKLYTVLSQVNQAIVHCEDPKELFDKVCQSAVEYGAFKMAWIGFVDAETRLLTPVCVHGDEYSYVENIRVSIDADSPFGGGPTGLALREQRPYWCQDFLHDDIARPWREQARRAGYTACAALPIQRGHEVVGNFNLYADQINAFDESARALLEEMAADIGFALDNFDREALRREVEQRLDLVIQGSSDAPWDWDLATDELYYSPQWWRMLGYEADELPGDTGLWRRLCHAEDLDRVEGALNRIQQPGHEWDSVECRVRHKDGHYVPVLIRGIVSRDDAGCAVRLTGTMMDLTEQKRTENELREHLDELNRWFKATIGREERIIELKREVNALLRQRKLSPRYPNAEDDEAAMEEI